MELEVLNGPVPEDGILPDEKQSLAKADPEEDPVDNISIRTHTGRCHQCCNFVNITVRFIMVVQGIGTLMPFNMFMMAIDYFTEYKLPPCDMAKSAQPLHNINSTISNIVIPPNDNNAHISYNISMETSTTTVNVTMVSCDSAIYRNYFLSSVVFVANVPMVMMHGINQCLNAYGRSGTGNKGFNIHLRIITSLVAMKICFLLTVILAFIDSSQWQAEFFWVTMITVAMINLVSGIHQNNIFAIGALLGYINDIIKGTNLSGIVCSLILIIAMSIASDIQIAAIVYFSLAIFVLIITLVSYFWLRKKRYFRERMRESHEGAVVPENKQSTPYSEIFKKSWIQFVGVWVTFFVSLTCFPAITGNVRKVAEHHFLIPEKYFTVVVCFLFFNVFAFFGNLLADKVKKPGPRWVLIPIFFRLAFIPLFVFCNFVPASGKRVLDSVPINSNWAFMFLMILLALSSGYFSSLTMMYAPLNVDDKYKGIAAGIASFFLVLGILSGTVYSFIITKFVEGDWP